MRVAYIVSLFPKISETFILREMLALRQRGVDIVVVSLKSRRETMAHPEAVPFVPHTIYPGGADRALAALFLRAWRQPLVTAGILMRVAVAHFAHPILLLKALPLVAVAAQAADLLVQRGVHRVHAHWATYPALVAWAVRRFEGIPYSLTAHAHDIFLPNPLLRAKIEESDFSVTISEYNRRHLERQCGVRAAAKVRVIHCGVPLAEYPFAPPGRVTDGGAVSAGAQAAGGGNAGPGAVRTPDIPGPGTGADGPSPEPDSDGGVSSKIEEVGTVPAPSSVRGADRARAAAATGRAARLVSIGRMVDYKGFPTLLRAVAALRSRGRDVTCDIIGDGPLEGAIRSEVRDLGLNGHVRLLGPKTQEQVRELLLGAAACVLACERGRDGQMDGIPVVLMEAMALGVPAVATRISGVPEIVEDGVTGLLASPRDAGSLAAAVERVLDDPALAARLAQAGRRRVEEQFDIARCAAALHALFETGGR